MPVGLYGEAVTGTDYILERKGRTNLSQVSFAAEGGCFDPAIDSGGTRLAFASTMHRATSDIYVKSIGGSTVTQVTSDPGDDVMPVFDPSGERLAFASNRSGQWNIYITSIDGGPAVQLTNDPDHELHPTWSPDGRMIAYCKFSARSGRWEVWAIEVENPGVRHFLEWGMFPQWSPDPQQSKLLFQRPRQRGSRLHSIWTIDYVDGEAMHPTEIVSAANAAIINPAWCPEGRRIAFVTVVHPEASASERPERSDIWVVNLDGSGRTRLTDGEFANFQPIWSSDGRVYFVSDRSGVDNIWAASIGQGTELTRTRGPAVAGADAER